MTIWQDLSKFLDNQPNRQFWWRDDDLVEPTEAGERLLKLACNYDIPITLAVIPESMKESLIPWLNSFENLNYQIAQHGFNHNNNAKPNQKKCELIYGFDTENLLKAKGKLQDLFPHHFKNMIVPPWNRFDASLHFFLNENYEKISTFGPEESKHFVNTHIDLIHWKEDKRALTEEEIFYQITESENNSIGLLTHHLVHEENHWKLLEKFFEVAHKNFKA